MVPTVPLGAAPQFLPCRPLAADLKLTVPLYGPAGETPHKRSPSPQVTRKKMHQPNDETSLALTESLKATLCQIAKSTRPTAMPIDTSKNR
jgi:hypothetical protein